MLRKARGGSNRLAPDTKQQQRADQAAHVLGPGIAASPAAEVSTFIRTLSTPSLPWIRSCRRTGAVPGC